MAAFQLRPSNEHLCVTNKGEVWVKTDQRERREGYRLDLVDYFERNGKVFFSGYHKSFAER